MAKRSCARRFTYWLTCVILRTLGVLFIGLRIHGAQWYPTAGGGLVCANHQSYFDPLIIGICCPRRMNFLARETLFRGMFGWVIHWYDSIPIQREGMGIGGIKESLRRLKQGELLLVFPEGTRTADGTMRPLEPGFIALARRARVPVIPVGVDGAYASWPRNQRWPKRHPVAIVVGEPLSAIEIEAMNDQELRCEVERRIRNCWETARRATTLDN